MTAYLSESSRMERECETRIMGRFIQRVKRVHVREETLVSDGKKTRQSKHTKTNRQQRARNVQNVVGFLNVLVEKPKQ